MVCSGCKNLNDQAKSGRPKTVDSRMVLQPIEANPASSTQKLLIKLGISQSNVFCHPYNLGNSIWSCKTIDSSY